MNKNNELFSKYFFRVFASYVEASIFLALAFFYPFAGFLALSFSLLSEYFEARLSLVVRHLDSKWPEFGNRQQRMLFVIAAGIQHFLYPSVFSFQALEAFLFIIAFMGFVSSMKKFFFARKIIAVAERNRALVVQPR